MADTYVLEESSNEEYELIPEDTVLEAKVTKVEEVTTKMTDEHTGEPVKQVKFTFAIEDEPYKSAGRLAWGRTSTKFTTHEKCRLRAWTTEIMGVDTLPTGFRLSLPALVGNYCRIVMSVREWEDKKAGPDPETGQPRYRQSNDVKEVIRSRNVRPAAADEPF